MYAIPTSDTQVSHALIGILCLYDVSTQPHPPPPPPPSHQQAMTCPQIHLLKVLLDRSSFWLQLVRHLPSQAGCKEWAGLI